MGHLDRASRLRSVKIDPSVLLIGPRGRRLCFEMARLAIEADSSQAAQEYRLAVGQAAYELDPGRGTSRVRLGSGGGEPVTPHHSPSAVARLLDDLPLAEPDERMLLRALTAAVDFARYWQEPDGQDVLAAAPEMRDALAGVATGVAQSPSASWWMTPLDLTTQWTVHLMEGRPSPSPPSGVAGSVGERLADWHTATVADEARARRERPRDPRASWSGTWWSTPPAELTRTTRSLGALGPVGLWLVEDAFNWDRATTRQVSASRDVTVYEVEGPEAWNPDQTYWLTDSTVPVSIEQSWRRNDNDGTWSQSES